MQAKAVDLAKYAEVKEEKRRIYSAMVDSMDQAIGVVLAALEKKKVADNTFVLFFSDNGAVSCGQQQAVAQRKRIGLRGRRADAGVGALACRRIKWRRQGRWDDGNDRCLSDPQADRGSDIEEPEPA